MSAILYRVGLNVEIPPQDFLNVTLVKPEGWHVLSFTRLGLYHFQFHVQTSIADYIHGLAHT